MIDSLISKNVSSLGNNFDAEVVFAVVALEIDPLPSWDRNFDWVRSIIEVVDG